MKKKTLNSTELLDYQPNRYPFLMIDYVSKFEPGKMANGYKNFTNNEWFFPIHFPGHPNVPGALQLEALAQMLTVAITTLPGNKGKTMYLTSANNLRFVIIDSISDLEQPKGIVINQEPKPNSKVKKKRRIYLTVTETNTSIVKFPDVLYLT